MGKVAALVLTEEDKTQDFTPSWLVPLLNNFRRIPSSADIRRHLPLWEGFWVPQKTNAQLPPPNFRLQIRPVIL